MAITVHTGADSMMRYYVALGHRESPPKEGFGYVYTGAGRLTITAKAFFERKAEFPVAAELGPESYMYETDGVTPYFHLIAPITALPVKGNERLSP